METTKRPWTYAGKTTVSKTDPAFYHANVICGGKRVARVSGVSKGEAMTFAFLIAAAPELLEACEVALLTVNRKSDTYEHIRTSIIKAKDLHETIAAINQSSP